MYDVIRLRPHVRNNLSYTFIHYGFQGEEHAIKHPPHRNATKGSTSYKRTKPSTLNRIKTIAKDHKAKVTELIDAEKGNIDQVESVDDLPRDQHQIRNIHQNLFTSCLLYTSPSPRDATLSRMPSSA